MAAKKSHLRAVGASEKPQKPKVHAKIADSLDGSSRDVLASMRRFLAKKLDEGEVSSNSIASAYKELRELDRLIRQIDDADEELRVDGGDADEAFDASAI